MNSECGVTVCPSITVSGNYSRLTNKPKINGVELIDNKVSEELGLLSSRAETYEEIEIAEFDKEAIVIVLTSKGAYKIPLAELRSGAFSTAQEPDLEKMKIGEFMFKKI